MRVQEGLLTSPILIPNAGAWLMVGRFFASNEIKIVLIYLLQMYEFRFPDGQTKRPENIYNEGSISPNTMQKVLFRQRG